jgi:hypothetical protein
MIFLHPTLLAKKYFPVLQNYVYPQGLSIIVLRPGWLFLSLPKLVEGEIRLYQRCSVVELAHHLVLLFLLIEA